MYSKLRVCREKTSAMLQSNDFMPRPCSLRSTASIIAMQSESPMSRDRTFLFCERDDSSQTEENGNNLCYLPQESPRDRAFPSGPERHFQSDNELNFEQKNQNFIQQPCPYSLDTFGIGPRTKECHLTNWTVRNSDGYQQELINQHCASTDILEDKMELATTEAESSQDNTSLFGGESYCDIVLVHLILSFPEAVDDGVWSSIQSSLKVSQSVTQQDFTIPQKSVLCRQRSEEISSSETKSAREISACFSVKDHFSGAETRHLFQLFLAVKETQEEINCVKFSWNKLNIIAFVQFPSTGQLLLPIEREVSRREAFEAMEGMFLGSFLVQNRQMFHHFPKESSLRRLESDMNVPCTFHSSETYAEEVVIVNRKDIVLEPNGARAGRPSHKETGQLLMTEAQVEKIFEIRRRWEGLSPRQRRDNVTPSDFYSFLTLNRDETAECLGVCATWLKDAIRSQGVNVWPGRPLRKTGAMLQTLKESLESTRAALRFSDPAIRETKRYEADIQRYESEIRDLVAMRIEIVKANVSSEYFDRYVRERGPRFLDPQWNALPPRPLKHNN